MMSDTELRVSVLLTMQVALLGNINQNVRGVTCKWDRETIILRAIFDGPISNDDRELIELAATEVLAHMSRHLVKVECIQVGQPEGLASYLLNAWVYRRFENA